MENHLIWRRSALSAGLGVAGALLVTLLLLAVLWIWQAGKALPNTLIAGVDVSRQDADGIRAALADLVAARQQDEVVFRFENDNHPLAPADRVGEGIRKERLMMESLREDADVVIDTTGLSPHDLRDRIREMFAESPPEAGLLVSIVSFGFKFGSPRDADLVIDVRFLPNPHYDDQLRPLTGMDREVVEYVEAGTEAGEFYGRLMPLLEFLLPTYVAEGKQHLTIAVGCTGGRHRSVTVADRIARELGGRGDVKLRVVHRDVELDFLQVQPV